MRVASLMIGLLVVAAVSCEPSDKTPRPAATTSDGVGGSTDTVASASDTSAVDGGYVHGSETFDDSDTALQEICDSEGNCYCLRMAVIGSFDSAANDQDKDVTAFIDWLNTKSNAVVDMYTQRQVLTDEFLSQYHVVLFMLQADTVDVRNTRWTYSQDEIAALQRWVEAGGGMVTVTGFNGMQTNEETAAINQLIAPITGISYNADDYLGNCPNSDCYCWGNTIPITGWDTTDPVMGNNLSAVGALHGYSINVPQDDEDVVVFAREPGGGLSDVAAAGKTVGKGKVFVFCDEWVLFTNQWLGDQQLGGNMDTYNPCWDGENQYWRTANNVFQVPQFWYNVISWAAPENECFRIDEPTIILL